MVQLVPIELPPAKDEPLARSPLRLVAFQVRHTGSPRLGEVPAGLAIHEAMGGNKDWRLELAQTQSVRIAAGIGGAQGAPPVEFQTGGWRLLSVDGKSTIAVAADYIGLEATAYPGWPSFSGTIYKLIDTVCQTAAPEAEVRLGLRYINRIEQPEVLDAAEWDKWVDTHLLGILHHPVGPGVTASQQQAQVDFSEDTHAVIGHGFFHDQNLGRFAYFMDFDAYRDGVRIFEGASIRAGVDALHGAVLQLFQSMVTERMYEYLRG
jgi:uncharacterized protein (TIGR04255 family)